MRVKDTDLDKLNIFLNKNKSFNKASNEKDNFYDILQSKTEEKPKKKFNVQIIAAKIARGENISSEELKYIKENAPTLYEEAKQLYIQKQREESEKDNEDNC